MKDSFVTPEQIGGALNWRYATKKFDPSKKLSTYQVDWVHRVLQSTPSSFGLQLWKFVQVDTPELRARVKEHAWKQTQATDASHLFVLCALEKIGESEVDKLIQHMAATRGIGLDSLVGYRQAMLGFIAKLSLADQRKWVDSQLYIALGNLMTACAAVGIDTCPMEGFDKPAVDQLLGLPGRGLRSVVMCPVGFRASDDNYASLKKVRYPISDLIEVL